MLTFAQGISLKIKNGTIYETLYLSDKPYMKKGNGIYADTGYELEDISNLTAKIDKFFNGPIVYVNTPIGSYEEPNPSGINRASIKGQSYKIHFENGESANIYAPAILQEYVSAFAIILKELVWKTKDDTILEVKEVTFKREI